MSRVRIAQISDLHFGTIKPGVAEGLARTLARLAPELILVTGDVTQRAKRREFAAAAAFVETLGPATVIVVPGNHDIPLGNVFGRVFDPYRGFRRVFGAWTERDYVHGRVIVSGLNSTSRWRHVQGAFDVARLDRRLSERDDDPQVVRIAAFHHPLDCAKPQDEKNLLKNADAVMDVFDRRGVDLMIGGHIHDPYVGLSRVRYPRTRRNMVIGVGGTATSWRIRKGAPNSFNLIEVETGADARLVVSRMDQTPDLGFATVRTHAFRRDAIGSWSVL